MKKNSVFYLFITQFIFTVLIFCSCGEMTSCTTNSQPKLQRLKILNWNLQTFFDGNFDGNEYAEYKNSRAGWSSQKYQQRLERAVEVFKAVDADVIILEELEKQEQLYDISNKLCSGFNLAKNYSYGFFGTSADSSIGCGILSRFPLENSSLHNIDISSPELSQPSLRPVIKIDLNTGEKILTIFINHWKSKADGEEKSRFWRNRQEALLTDLIVNSKNKYFIAAGDFNQNINEFCYREDDSTNIILRGKSECSVYSPWILENGEYKKPGSYWFQNQWERIDHFFAAKNVKILEFNAEKNGSWADSEGHPLRYTIWNGQGYSDHLPVTCTIEF